MEDGNERFAVPLPNTNATYQSPVVSVELSALYHGKCQELAELRNHLAISKKCSEEAEENLRSKRSAWEQGGKPDENKLDVEAAERQLLEAKTKTLSIRRGLTRLRVNRVYLQVAQRTRFFKANYVNSWLATSIVLAAVLCACFLLFGTLIMNSLLRTLLLGMVGFVCGFLLAQVLLFVPS